MPDPHVVLVEAVLVAPAPGGPRPDVPVGGPRLRETEELARHLGARRMLSAVMLLQWLTLVGGAVAVLPKDGLPATRGAGQSDGGIAANRHHFCALPDEGADTVSEATCRWCPQASARGARDDTVTRMPRGILYSGLRRANFRPLQVPSIAQTL